MKGKGKDMSKVELTETQKNIIQIRKRMNRRSIEEEKFNGFTKRKCGHIYGFSFSHLMGYIDYLMKIMNFYINKKLYG